MIFHWYGLFLGLGIVSGVLSAQWLVSRIDSKLSKHIDALALWAIIGGVIGARIYHIATDWQLYVGASFLDYIAVWRGGLGLWGAIGGGLFSVLLYMRKLCFTQKQRIFVIDSIGFGLPIAQAIGRIGNGINQEVFGKITTLPWGIVIHNSTEKYHPLFVYEMVLLILLWLGMRWLIVHKHIQLATGNIFAFWLMAYGSMRFLLEYLRYQTAMFGVLSVAQWVSLGAGIVGFMWWKKIHFDTKIIVFITACVALLGTFAFVQPQRTKIKIADTTFSVEVVRTPKAIEKGLSDRDALGSDGMLFVMPSRTTPAFWMKHMRFSLDFVWIDGNMIVDLYQDAPVQPVDTLDRNQPIYRPRRQVTHVLELPAGSINQFQLKIGDVVRFGVR